MCAQTETIMVTSKSWDGVDLPDYLVGKPELRTNRVIVPPHTAMAQHHHPVMSCAYILKGKLTVVRDNGVERTFLPGESFAEVVNSSHHGENRGDEPVEMIVFLLSQEGQTLQINE